MKVKTLFIPGVSEILLPFVKPVNVHFFIHSNIY